MSGGARESRLRQRLVARRTLLAFGVAGASALGADLRAQTAPYVPEALWSAPAIPRAPRAPLLIADRFHAGPSGAVSAFRDAAAFGAFASASAFDAETASHVRLYFENGGGPVRILNVERGASPDAIAAAIGSAGDIGPIDFAAAPFARVLPAAAAGAVYRALLLRARAGRGLVFIDTPSDLRDPATIGAWVGGLDIDDRDVAAFASGMKRAGAPFAASTATAAAGLYHAAPHIWRAPAGTTSPFKGVELAAPAAASGATALAARNINALRADRTGVFLWGARTMSPDPEWRYLPVRRLALHLERSLQLGLDWTVFEANGPALWNEVRRVIADFLDGYWREGAFAGTRSEQAFFVKCDASTTSESERSAGRFRALIGIAPLKPSEFLILSANLSAAP